MSGSELLFSFRLWAVLDRLGHAFRLEWVPGFWRICDAYDLSLGVPDTPANFPRRWSQ